MSSEKRNYYRIDYRPEDRPVLTLEGRAFFVLDLSEEGLKYRHPGAGIPAAGRPVQGDLVFGDKTKMGVTGSVLRTTGEDVVVHLDPPIPFAKVIAEQRRLLAKYPSGGFPKK